MAAAVLFWVSIALLVYTYVGYPLLIAAWARWRPHRRAEGVAPPLAPSVSILWVARDEGPRAARRLEELLGLRWPSQVQILVGSDGSRDDTVAQLRGVKAGAFVEILAYDEARGKPAVLADLAQRASGELLVFCDTRQHLREGVLEDLLAPFADGDVGAVSGTLGGTVNLGAYWRYETFLRGCESRVDSLVGATGALYAVRRRLFQAPPADTLLDDMLIPLRVVRQGYRLVFAAGAQAEEVAEAGEAGVEWRRRVRTQAGCFQLLRREGWLWAPGKNRIWWQVLSHKALRLVCPVFMLVALVTSAVLAGGGSEVYRGLLVGQVVVYAAGAAGMLPGGRAKPRVLAIPATFVMLQAAVVVGFWRVLRGRQRVTWKAGPRPAG